MKLCFLIFHNSKRINKKMMKEAHNVRRIKRHFLRGISRGQTKAGKKTGHQKAIARYCEEEKRQLEAMEAALDRARQYDELYAFITGFRLGGALTREAFADIDGLVDYRGRHGTLED